MWCLFLLALELLNSNLLNNCFAIIVIALSHYILREWFKEVFDLRCLFFAGLSGFFSTRYFCHLTWCDQWNYFGVWDDCERVEMGFGITLKWIFTAGRKIHSWCELLVPTSFSPYLFSPTWSYLQLISIKHRLLMRNCCFEMEILKSNLTSQLWLWGAISPFSPCPYAPAALDSSYVAILWPQNELIFSIGSAVFQGRISDGSGTWTMAVGLQGLTQGRQGSVSGVERGEEGMGLHFP